MGKKLIKIIMIFGAICALCHCPAHAAQTVDIEQVSINKPDIRVYFYTGSGRAIKKEQVSARLGDESCSVRKVYLYKKSSVGIRYYLLVDISASVPAAYFEQYKQAILSLVDKMDAQDELVLISFGDKIRTEYEGKGNKNKIRAALSDLKNDNQNTLFYEAIQKTVSYVDESNDDKRNVVAVFSDGEDWARGSVTKRETRNTLLEKQIPLYAMAVDMGHEQWIDTFGEFARETGGRIYLLSPGQIQQSLVRLQKDLKKATVAEFEAETNLVSGKKETFLLTFDGGDLRKSVKVVPYKWKKDKKPPTITRAEAVGKDQIKLVFSEDVEQAATPSNYELERNGKTIVPAEVSYEKKTALLTLKQERAKGTYTIKTKNICDHSMEQNRLSEPFEVYLDGHGIAYRASHFALRYWWVWLILVLLVLLLLVLSRINKKKKQSVEITEEKIIVGKDTEYKQHIIIDQKQGFPAELIVQTGASGTEAIPVTINGSIMIGRSEINDVYFDDEKMSKQHFALIVDEQNHVFMEDLNSTNGTFVNGVQIHDRTKLECGDEISAGSVEMIIWW